MRKKMIKVNNNSNSNNHRKKIKEGRNMEVRDNTSRNIQNNNNNNNSINKGHVVIGHPNNNPNNKNQEFVWTLIVSLLFLKQNLFIKKRKFNPRLQIKYKRTQIIIIITVK